MTNKDKPFIEKLPKPFIEPSGRWVRVKAGDQVLADSKSPLLLIQYPPESLPTYFFPAQSVDTAKFFNEQIIDNKIYWDIKLNGQEIEKGAWSYTDPPADLEALTGQITFTWWHKAVSWFEEEEQVYAHARDPYHRVDILASSRHIQIKVNDNVIAESRRPFLLFETNLPTRYYLPHEDVHMEFLEKSPTRSYCPYKGKASYWNIRSGGELFPDLVWSYKETIPENPKVNGLMAFFNEKVDIILDGEFQERPQTHWS